ncbi:MAG: sensor histidine kinase [Bacteroidetes bacterium]|nr:sensor histidine kinase [Bacteroidota bacterium]
MMKHFIKIIFALCILLTARYVCAQSLADSIIKIHAASVDTIKLNAYLKAASSLHNKDAKNAIKLCKEVITLAEHNKLVRYAAEANLIIGLAHYFTGEHQLTLRDYLQSIALFEKCKDEIGKARVHNELGNFYGKQKKYTEAEASFIVARDIAKKYTRDDVYATAINNLGSLAQTQGNHTKALLYFTEAIVLYEKLKDSIGISYGLDYRSISLSALGKNAEAITQQIQALAIRTRLKDSNAMAVSLINLAEIEFQTLRIDDAEQHMLQCLEISEKINYKDLSAYTCKMLAALYAKKGNATQAYAYHVKYAQLNEEIFNANNRKQIDELQTKYESEKKIQQIKLLQAQQKLKAEQTAKQRNIFIGFILLLGVCFLGIIQYQKRKKQHELDTVLIAEKIATNRAIIEAEEKERLRIARDLHDGVAQTMVAAKMQLESFIENLSATDEQPDTLKNAYALVQDAASEVRAVSHSMIPNALLKSGLVAAVRDFVHRMGNEKLKINLQIVGLNQRLSIEYETVIFRVLQELINNIIKHANANEIGIQFIREDHEFTMIIEDNGTGFDTTKLNEQSGVGVKNSMARVSYLKGQIHFDSQKGHGTTVIVEIPIDDTL